MRYGCSHCGESASYSVRRNGRQQGSSDHDLCRRCWRSLHDSSMAATVTVPKARPDRFSFFTSLSERILFALTRYLS
jgi:hypothetical protein